MHASVPSAAIHGIEAVLVTVEVDISPGLPAVHIVGLPDAAVQEARERIRAAIRNAGFEFPLSRLAINLSPADQRKEGAAFDLPIAVAVLIATHQIQMKVDDGIYVGELTLHGDCRVIPGAIAYAQLAQRLRRRLVVPEENAIEASLIPDTRIYTVRQLREVCAPTFVEPHRVTLPSAPVRTWNMWPAIRGQAVAKRAAEIAVAGGHNLLMSGPPGTGKTMIAEGMTEIIPDLDDAAAIEVLNIASLAGLRQGAAPFTRRPPFRHPHHSASVASCVGGGRIPRPGEFTVAHHGILFMDEFPEFSREHIESLRQPLEQGMVVVSRVAGSIEFPAAFMLVAAMNPCPCGYAGDRTRPCVCAQSAIRRYRQRISGPILDRFDLAVTLNRVEGRDVSVSTDDPRLRVIAAREQQKQRGQKMVNAYLRGRTLMQQARLTMAAAVFLRTALDRLHLSLRAHDRVIRVARTIADLAGELDVTEHHVAEAIQYRPHALLDGPSRTIAG